MTEKSNRKYTISPEDEVEQLKAENKILKAKMKYLDAENANLDKENQKLKARIAELEQDLEESNRPDEGKADAWI